MEKRNVISPDRTPTMEKQSSMDDMEKEAVAVFKAAPVPCGTPCNKCKCASKGKPGSI